MADAQGNSSGHSEVGKAAVRVRSIADLCRLALYGDPSYIDDSGFMAFEEQDERIKDPEVSMHEDYYEAIFSNYRRFA